jgi:glycosyltransferase involved in cell wall biosynthesis
MVALEAMSAGAPVLLSNAEANLEFGLEPHVYFPAGDIGALSEKLASESYDVFRSARAAKVLRDSNWDEIAAKTLRIYQLAVRQQPQFTEDDAFDWARDVSQSLGRRNVARSSAPNRRERV